MQAIRTRNRCKLNVVSASSRILILKLLELLAAGRQEVTVYVKMN